MKRILITIGILGVLLLTIASLSCSASGGGNVTATLGQEFTLQVGKTADFDSESLSIQFVEVTADSRCPKGVECVSAGEAQCRLYCKIYGSPADMTLTQTDDAAGSDYFLDYKITFKLEPYPQAGQTIAPSDYKLVMTLTK
jgi:hypothetical protein